MVAFFRWDRTANIIGYKTMQDKKDRSWSKIQIGI